MMPPRRLTDAERSQLRAERMRRLNADPDFRTKRREALSSGIKKPGFSKYLQRRWQEPEYRATMEAVLQRPEVKQRATDALRAARRKPDAERRRGRMSRADAARLAIIANARSFHGVTAEVPAWVPNGLIFEFCEASSLYGEEHAASVIRAMKRAEAEQSREGDHA